FRICVHAMDKLGAIYRSGSIQTRVLCLPGSRNLDSTTNINNNDLYHLNTSRTMARENPKFTEHFFYFSLIWTITMSHTIYIRIIASTRESPQRATDLENQLLDMTTLTTNYLLIQQRVIPSRVLVRSN
ncbi:hypothetical protein HAX54_007940, partial [Datura stramonium]|nr:hypothetical protein [Datura stramonium]